MLLITLYSVFIISCHAGILPTGTQNDHKSRVLDLPLSQQEHYTDLDKDQSVEHNTAYDHEAFLGVDEAKKFEKLSVEESKKRLGTLFNRIDKDHNGTITKQELKDWIKSVQTRYITEDVERQWKQMNNDSNTEISWDEYDKTTYYALCSTESMQNIVSKNCMSILHNNIFHNLIKLYKGNTINK